MPSEAKSPYLPGTQDRFVMPDPRIGKVLQEAERSVVGKRRLEKDEISKLIHESISCTSTAPLITLIRFRHST